MSPRTKAQFQEMREKTRYKILESALDLFAHYGFQSTTIDKIAQNSGVSKGLIYNHFSSKDELLDEVINYGLQIFEGMMDIFEGSSPTEVLNRVIDMSFDPEIMNNEFYLLYFSILMQPYAFNKYKGVFKPLINQVVENLSRILDDLGFADSRQEARLLTALIDGMQLHCLMVGEEYPIEEMKTWLKKRYGILETKRY